MADSDESTVVAQLTQMDAKFQEAKTWMDKEDYPAALSSLMKVINMCPCRPSSHGKDKSCNIRQCVVAIQHSDPDALYQVATGPCSCGFLWPSCTRLTHINALDALVGCLEKTKHHAAAFSTALGLIRLDPASAIGYCRVARIIRYLVKNHQGPDQHVARSLAVILRDAELTSVKRLRHMIGLFAKCGLRNAEKYRHRPNDNYHAILRQISHNLNLPESRKDPFTKLPRELISMIFSYLDTTSVIRTCRVSKLWRQTIEADRALWSHIRLKKPRSSRYFGKFLQRHREVRSLVINDVSSLGFSGEKLGMLLCLPNLRRLYIGSSKELVLLSSDQFNSNMAKLQKLSLAFDSTSHGPYRNRTWGYLAEALSPYLQVLDLAPGPGYGLVADTGKFPRLKRLSLLYPRLTAVDINRLAEATPNLEYLSLGGCATTFDSSRTENGLQKILPWPSLRSLSVSDNSRPLVDRRNHPFAFPLLPNTLEVVEIMADGPQASFFLDGLSPDPEGVQFLGDSDIQSVQSLNLETFRCRAPLSPAALERMIGPAVRSGALKVLELSGGLGFTGPQFDDPRATEAGPADLYPFASSDHVHTLGMHNFNWAHGGDHYSVFNGEPFLDWLKCFPNVKTVMAYPGPLPNVAPFLMKLICHPGIEVVHQDYLRGVEWDEVRKLAEKNGVRLYHTPKHTPIGWPLIN